MKEVDAGTMLKIVGIVFAAGMLYKKIESSAEKTRMQIESLQERIQDQKEAVNKINEYLAALRRNGL